MKITRIFERGKEALRLKLDELASNPLLILHYLDYNVRSILSQVPELAEIDYRKAKAAMVTLKGDDAADFRDFLNQGTILKSEILWMKHVKPFYYENHDEKKGETTFWVVFAYLALGTIRLRTNIANMDDTEIKLWEEAVGEAMRYDHGVTVISK